MDNEKEIPFGAFDSELMHQEIFIPEGFKATIEGNRIILTRKESEDERIRKELIEFVKSRGGFKQEYIAWLEKQDPKKHQEELDAAYKTADKVQYRRGYKAAWEEMGEQPPMQNGIIINGVEYELIEDREDDECERCALSDICHDARKEVICNPIFGDLSISHRFEKRKL